MYNNSSIRESRWSQPSSYFLIKIIHKAIAIHNRETSQLWTKIELPIPSFMICTQMTKYFSTRCCCLPKNVLKDNVRWFFYKNPWLDTLVLRRQGRVVTYQAHTQDLFVYYYMYKIEKCIMAKLKVSIVIESARKMTSCVKFEVNINKWHRESGLCCFFNLKFFGDILMESS